MNTPPVPPAPVVSYDLMSSVKSVLSRYVMFSGRACRSEYWFFQLALFIVYAVISVLAACTTPEVGYLGDVINLAVFLPGLGLTVRRLHDTGRSAWNLLWVLLPIIGYIVLLVFTIFASDKEPNKYGDAPLPPVA